MKPLLLIVALLLVCGCDTKRSQSEQKFFECEPGMTAEEVELILGPPDTTTEMPTAHLEGKAKTSSMSVWAVDDGNAAIMIHFEDGKVKFRTFVTEDGSLMPDIER